VLVGPREDHRPGRRVDLLARELEHGVTRHDHVELLVPSRAPTGLVMGLDHEVALVVARVGVDPEGGDAERLADRLQDRAGDVDPLESG
jgi:hypothetical protein